MRVLAVAESDAYVKWAAWLLERAPAWWSYELCLARSPVSPSAQQVATALAGTTRAIGNVCTHGLIGLRRRIAESRPDVVVLALTGPAVAAVTAVLSRPRPVIVAGIPGVGLPVRERALRARLPVDVFVAHSHREREEYEAGFRAIGAETRVALATLPFLATGPLPPPDTDRARPVFAAQPSVPATREERVRVLELLARIGPPAPLVKLRRTNGERLTHNEPFPYPELWRQLVASGRAERDAVEFGGGALGEALVDASCLVTVSSTAALEAIDRNRPVVIVDDFGVSESLLNEVFVGSGLFAPLQPCSLQRARPPRADWSASNYFHPISDDDWVAVVESACADWSVRQLPCLDRTYLTAAGRAVLRRLVPGTTDGRR